MSELPISDEAVEAAAKALFDHDWIGAKVQPAWDETPAESRRARREEAETAIRAFLTAEGFEVDDEYPYHLGHDAALKAGRLKQQQRLVSPWHPQSEAVARRGGA